MEENELRVAKIKQLRNSLRLTQSEFASKLGMNRSYINRVECGSVNISDILLDKMCSTFQVPRDFFDSENSSIEMSDITEVKTNANSTRTPLVRALYSKLNALIEYRGASNIYFQKDLNEILSLIYDYLLVKDSINDVEEKDIDFDEWETSILEKIQDL